MKNYLLALFCAIVCMCFIACKGGDSKQNDGNGNDQTEQVSSSSESEKEISTSEEEDQKESTDEAIGHLAQIKAENIILPKEIRDAVEIIPEDDGFVYCDFDENDYPTVSLTFKLLKTVNTSSISPGQMWIVGHAQDIKGRDINDLNPKSITSREWRTGDSDGSAFKGFLEGDVDETLTLDFTGENNIELFEKDQSKIQSGKKQTAEAAKKFEKFKLTITN